MKSKRYRYSLPSQAFGYVSLFLLGVIGWTCDRLAGQYSGFPDRNNRKEELWNRGK